MPDLNIEIVTPNGVKLSGEIRSCFAPGTEGQFQILSGHAPLLSILEIGEIKIQKDDGIQLLATSGGFLEVKANLISIVVESAEFAADIDIERARAAEERAKNRLKTNEEIDVERAKFALLRALNRIKISSHI
jgi:F-type H+-transporting ATPase subunit epsilon